MKPSPETVLACRRFAGQLAAFGCLDLLDLPDDELVRVVSEGMERVGGAARASGVTLAEVSASLDRASKIMRAVSETAIRH